MRAGVQTRLRRAANVETLSTNNRYAASTARSRPTGARDPPYMNLRMASTA